MQKSTANIQEPLLQVGILLNQKSIDFSLLGTYYFQKKEYKAKDYTVEFVGGKLLFVYRLITHGGKHTIRLMIGVPL